MLKAEIYKLFHSKNLFILLMVIIPVALYLGIMLPQMGVASIEEVLVMVFVGASAVIMLYFAVLATMLINRDYSSNSYRILVGMGISRIKIFLSKYFIFLLVGIIVVALHGGVASIFPCVIFVDDIKWSNFFTSFLYIVVYASIISCMFLLATIGRSVIKSIAFNVAFILLMSILSMLPLSYVKIFPLQFLQMVADGQNEQYVKIAIASLVYIIISGIASYLVFEKQEL